MRTLTQVLGLLFFRLLLVPAIAGPLEDGTEAFKQEDYAAALKLLQPLADQGNAQAQLIVGAMHLEGMGVPENSGIGLRWVRKAADQGQIDAQARLGSAYLSGQGIKLNYAEAMNWLIKAADQGNRYAQHTIGEMYEKGLGVPKNQAEARKWYDKSRRRPQLPKEVAEGLAATTAITLYSLQPRGGPDIPEWDFHGHHVLGRSDLPPDKAKAAIAALNTALAAGDANLISGCLINPRHALAFKADGDSYDILICYECGQLQVFRNKLSLPFAGMIGGKPDVLNGLLKAADIPLADSPAALQTSYAKEAKVALTMAEQGDTKAQDVIARMFLSGRGVKVNAAEGIQWLAKSLASTPDNPDFLVRLGSMYRRGEDVKENESEALKLFQQAAAQGSVEAQRQIAEMHEYGEGVAKNTPEAIRLFRHAAEHGNAKAQFEIGVRCAQGRDVKQDYAEALQWLQKAADQVHPEALFWMGTLYEKGWGVTQDPLEAYFWDRLADSYGTIYGSRSSFRPSLEQRTVVEKRLADWIAAHPKPPLGWQSR